MHYLLAEDCPAMIAAALADRSAERAVSAAVDGPAGGGDDMRGDDQRTKHHRKNLVMNDMPLTSQELQSKLW